MAEDNRLRLCAQEGCRKVATAVIQTQNADIINVCGDHMMQLLIPVPIRVLGGYETGLDDGPYESVEGGELRPVQFITPDGISVDNNRSFIIECEEVD